LAGISGARRLGAGVMKQFLLTLAGVFAGLLLFFVGLPFLLIAGIAAGSRPEPAPAATVLALDLRDGLTDQSPTNPFASFGSGLSVMNVAETLRKAERDGKVKALLIRLPESGMEPAAAEELRLAVKSFRAAGKPVYAHSQGLYPAGVVSSTYMLGAAADQFWMQENASFQVTGLSSEEVFFKGLFDRFGVVPQFEQRGEYKNAVNPFLQSGFTPEHREATASWLGSVYASALSNVAADRGKNAAALRATLEAGPYTAQAARQQGLIDRLGHVEQAREALLDRFGDEAELVEFGDYDAPEDKGGAGRPLIAVVEAEGPIITGDADDAGFGGGQTIYSDQIAEALYDAAEDEDVKAVVFRVSSPGGSDTASDQILAALNAVKTAGKPVVVSMGTYAASGGYWISSQADRIVAHPSTLTGSIGVYGGKLALGPALERYGVNLEDVTVGSSFAGAYGLEPFNQAQRAAFSGLIDQTYREFIARVAAGRKLTPERVQELARGRVWTGAQARELGLVDELGGFQTAVAAAKRLAKIDADQAVRFKRLPGAQSPFEALESFFGVSAQSARTLAAAGWLLGDPRAAKMMDGLMEARLRDQGANVLAPTPF
jgi:protease IV